ncbi:hypothetical protein HNQ56_002884 [Anaerotaenia torta]|uniref:PqqD family protein n=1 Tax=Anaerotaenia torta TaxID=433293 RepID=UPI003D1A0D9F
MKLKEGFILHQAGKERVAVAAGEAGKSFHGLMYYNNTASFLFEKLINETTEEEMVQAVLDRYEVDKDCAMKDVREFIAKLSGAGVLE